MNEQAKSVTVMDCDNYPITLTAIQTQTENGDYWLKIKSPQKELKELAMIYFFDANAGIYFLRTSIERLDEKTTWEYYNLIR